jgi:hypothetical protein
MTTWAEVLHNGTIGGEELLGMTRGLQPLHASLPLARRLVGVLRPVMEIAVLAMVHPWKTLSLSTVRRNYAASCSGGGASNLASSLVLVYVHLIGFGCVLSSAK